MNIPLVLPLIAFISGIATYTLTSICIYAIMYTGIAIITALYTTTKISHQAAISCLFFFLCGIGQTFLQQYLFNTTIQKYTHKTLNLKGIVANKKQLSDKFQQRITIDVYQTSMPADTAWILPLFTIQCFIHSKNDICVGDYITINTVTIPSMPQKKELGMDCSFADYLQKENILPYIYLDNKKNKITISRPNFSWKRWLWEKRQTLHTKILNKLTYTTRSFFSLIFLGNKTTAENDQLIYSCHSWGISHFLARSGLHISLLILIWSYFFSIIPIHITIKRILLILLAIIYHFLSWTSISFFRAYMLFLCLYHGHILSQRTLISHLFTVICFFVLFYNPHQLFFLDFQLSFGLTFVLIFFCLPHKYFKKKKL